MYLCFAYIPEVCKGVDDNTEDEVENDNDDQEVEDHVVEHSKNGQ